MVLSLELLMPAQADDWPVVPLSGAGFDADVGGRLDAAVENGELPNLHAVVVARQSQLALERYYEGPDERWGESIGNVAFGPDIKHDLRSVSKSIVSLLYGIALGQSKVPVLNEPIVDSFPYDDLKSDPERRRMTVAHALTMSLGIEWDESLPYTDPRNSEIAMELATDRYRFILERPFVAKPGTVWNYSGGATALLARLISDGTNMPLDGFAWVKLFEPLGITDTEWVKGLNGEPAAASGLRLRPRDLAKIGQLVLDKGRWNDQQVVPADWLEASTQPRFPAGDGLEYGYQWWLGKGRVDGQRWIAGFGNGGQRLVIMPNRELVVVVMAGNYNDPEAWKLSVKIIGEFLLPAFHDT